jgi:hypothetical protein
LVVAVIGHAPADHGTRAISKRVVTSHSCGTSSLIFGKERFNPAELFRRTGGFCRATALGEALAVGVESVWVSALE